MRVLICGDREWTDEKMIEDFIKKLPKDTIIIEGEARGADTIARRIAEKYGLKVLKFPADWNMYGKAAGPIRNGRMIVEGKPNIVVAFHNNITKSKGTKDMIKKAKNSGINVEIRNSGN